MSPTNFRKPRTGDKKLRVQWRNGQTSIHTYTAAQLRWSDSGHEFDVVAVEYAGEAA